MGFFSWFSTTASKSSAAVLIQTTFEALARGGILESQPAPLANRVVEAAFDRVPKLADAKYNKHVLALAALAMAPILPSLTVNERQASKHALGMLLKDVLDLEMKNALALTLSERGVVEQAQQAFLNMAQPSAAINLDQRSDKIQSLVFSNEEVQMLRMLSVSIGKNVERQGFVDFVPIGDNAAAAGIGLITARGEKVAFASVVKSFDNKIATVSARGFDGNRLPDAPESFADVNAAIDFMQPYLQFISEKCGPILK